MYSRERKKQIMRVKVYVNKDGVVYSEKEIKEALPDIIANYEYFGVYDYIMTHYTEKELFNLLNEDTQKKIYKYLTDRIIEEDFHDDEIELDDFCPNCPFIK